MLSWWQVLGVDEDAEISTIKKAYSKLIKAHRPDEDPEEFNRIREAYEAAKQFQRIRELVTVLPTETEPEILSESELTGQNEPETIEPDAVEISSAEELYLGYLDQLNQWESSGYKESRLSILTKHEALFDFHVFVQLQSEVLDWLEEKVKVLPGFLETTVTIPGHQLRDLDSVFNWSKNRGLMTNHYCDSEYDLVFDVMEGKAPVIPKNVKLFKGDDISNFYLIAYALASVMIIVEAIQILKGPGVIAIASGLAALGILINSTIHAPKILIERPKSLRLFFWFKWVAGSLFELAVWVSFMGFILVFTYQSGKEFTDAFLGNEDPAYLIFLLLQSLAILAGFIYVAVKFVGRTKRKIRTALLISFGYY